MVYLYVIEGRIVCISPSQTYPGEEASLKMKKLEPAPQPALSTGTTTGTSTGTPATPIEILRFQGNRYFSYFGYLLVAERPVDD